MQINGQNILMCKINKYARKLNWTYRIMIVMPIINHHYVTVGGTITYSTLVIITNVLMIHVTVLYFKVIVSQKFCHGQFLYINFSCRLSAWFTQQAQPSQVTILVIFIDQFNFSACKMFLFYLPPPFHFSPHKFSWATAAMTDYTSWLASWLSSYILSKL